MMSFGNILEKSIREIWEETSRNFRLPGHVCYANKSNDHIAARKPSHWPLDRAATIELLRECPSYDLDKIPEFYKRMGSAEKFS
jgi:hypothetical protein